MVSDKTIVLDEQNIPLIFGWLIDLQTERRWRISRDAYHIGSGRVSDLHLEGGDVKDLHCSIYYVLDHFEINDNNSQSGTRINDRDVKRQALADDDVISIGRFALQFKCFKGMKYG